MSYTSEEKPAGDNFDAMLETLRQGMEREAQIIKALYDVLKFNGLPEPLIFKLVIRFQIFLWSRKM